MSILTAYDKFIQQALKYGFSLWGTAKTGQTTQYELGDDGSGQYGYPKVPPRFKDNGDGTITDNASGLMWVKEPGACGGAFGTPGSPAKMTWVNAIDNCLLLDYAGHRDWRLPNIKTLYSIVDYGRVYECIDPLFPDTKAAYYWTGTTYLLSTDYAWVISFGEGETWVVAKAGADAYVRPVRLGVPK